jgi:hypothetical protein
MGGDIGGVIGGCCCIGIPCGGIGGIPCGGIGGIPCGGIPCCGIPCGGIGCIGCWLPIDAIPL